MKRKSLLILSRAQFGYDLYYFYCKFAAKHFRITYVGFDTGRPTLSMQGVSVKYVSWKGGRVLRYLRFMAVATRAVRRCDGAVLVKYFPGCSMLRCFARRARLIVDIRTRSIYLNRHIGPVADQIMRWESRLFHNIAVISQTLADRLRLPPVKTHIIPLGAELASTDERRLDRLDLLYVGTLHGRRIEDTIIGLRQFLRDDGGDIPLTYTIVGSGMPNELEQLRSLVRSQSLQHCVRMPGFVHRTQLGGILNHCNVGISYVPINDLYDCQPVTKTFEYLLAGMPVIATATTENKKVINERNGVLIQDTPEDFCRGLKELRRRRSRYDSDAIQRSCPQSSWDHIITQNLIPYIEHI